MTECGSRTFSNFIPSRTFTNLLNFKLISSNFTTMVNCSRVAGLRRRRARVQIAAATLSGNSLRQTAHTHRASVHQTAKLLAALLRLTVVTAGLAENNGSHTAGFMTHVTYRLTAMNRDQLRNPTLGNRVRAAFTFFNHHARFCAC